MTSISVEHIFISSLYQLIFKLIPSWLGISLIPDAHTYPVQGMLQPNWSVNWTFLAVLRAWWWYGWLNFFGLAPILEHLTKPCRRILVPSGEDIVNHMGRKFGFALGMLGDMGFLGVRMLSTSEVLVCEAWLGGVFRFFYPVCPLCFEFEYRSRTLWFLHCSALFEHIV